MDSDLAEAVASLKDIFARRSIPATFGKAAPATVESLRKSLRIPARFRAFLGEADPVDVETVTPVERVRLIPSAFLAALGSPVGLKIIGVGAVISAVHAVALVLVSTKVLGVGGPRLAGFVSGSQTQPAILAFANSTSHHDERVALGYALVYPVAMVTKIVVAQILTIIG